MTGCKPHEPKEPISSKHSPSSPGEPYADGLLYAPSVYAATNPGIAPFTRAETNPYANTDPDALTNANPLPNHPQ